MSHAEIHIFPDPGRCGGAGAVALFASSGAQAVPFSFTASGGCSEACSASATITPGAGTLTAVLTDTQANPRSAGDLLSSIEITPSGALGTPTLTSQNGSLIDVTPGAATGTPVAGNPTHWGVGTSGGQIVLETAGPFAVGGKPINMIIGPAPFTNSNASIGNFDPYIDQTGTFVINDPSITASTSITGVVFNFGTGPDTFITGVPVPAPPIGHSLPVLLAVGGILFGAEFWGRCKKRPLGTAMRHAS